MSIDSSHSSFILDNEEFFLLPGSRFSAKELKARLKEMNINVYNSQDREYLKQLYDSAIQDYNNRVKILHRLRRDTEVTNLRLNQSDRQPMPYNLNISGNLPQNKVMNISQDNLNLNPNLRQKQINKGKPLYNNDMDYSHNQPISNMKGYNEYNNRNSYDNNFNLNNINRENNYDYNKQIQNNQYRNDSYDMNNYSNNNEYNNKKPSYNNNYQNYNNQYEKINIDINDNTNNNIIQQYSYNQKTKREIGDKNKYNFKKKSNNNIHIIPESKYENDSDEYDNNDNNNYMNQPNYQKINIIPEKIQTKNKRKDTPYKSNNTEDNILLNPKNRQMINNIGQDNENSFIKALYEGIEVNNNKLNSKDKDNNDDNDNKKINNKKETINAKKDDDDKSFFSFFSVFENAKKSPLYKYRKFILIHLMVLLAFLLISIGFLQLIYNHHESIMNFISDIFKILTDPRRILNLVTSFISALLLGPIHYWYVSIPLLVIGFVLFILMRKYLFNKRCKEIIEKIVEYLQNGENENISEEDIYKKFVQTYGITYNKFLKKYLPKLNKMRRSDNRLKQSSMKINEKVYVFWELTK